MISLPLTLAGRGKASAGGLLHALEDIGRWLLLAAVFVVMVAMRSQTAIYVNLGLTALAFGGLYALFGRRAGMKPLALYLLGFALFAQLRSFADETGVAVQTQYAIDFEHALFGVIPSVWLQEHVYRAGSLDAIGLACSAVYVSYFITVHGVALLIWTRRRSQFALYAGAVMLTFYLGLLVSFLLPTTPPWLAGDEGAIPEVHRIFPELMARLNSASYESGATVAGVNDVAAMPSLHTGITVLLALAAWRFSRSRVLRGLGVFYACAMGFALVYLGEHYFVDVAFGAATAAAAWAVACRFWSASGVAGRAPLEAPAAAAATTRSSAA